ncbi:hypothetical protein D9758_015212 [Tetrapyrgos nigripes]|uniref:Uncharacterized protein n=1 Tax=Tetrapyrgos nigripes TaxID=182062 RepID=A0A8H5CK03_9AGAR|nr:hypothetical protein D9758_015212 [Tetrapyrgos nigripes]
MVQNMSAKLAFVLLALNAGVYALPAAIANTTSSASPSGTTGEPGGISGQNHTEHIIHQLCQCQNQTKTKPPIMDKGKRAATPIIDPPPGGDDGDIQKLIKQLCEEHKQYNGTYPSNGTMTHPGTYGSSTASQPPYTKRAAPYSEQPSAKPTGPDGPGGKSGEYGNHGGQGEQGKECQGTTKLIEELCSKHTKGPGHGAPGGSNSTSSSTALGDSSPTEKRAAAAGEASGHHEDLLEKLCSYEPHWYRATGSDPTGTGKPGASSKSSSPGSSESSTSTGASSPAKSSTPEVY